MFQITGGKGFKIQIGTKVVSVQFGPSNYCERYNADFYAPQECTAWTSNDAEVAVMDAENGAWHTKDYGDFNDDVVGRVSALDVVQLLLAVSVSEGFDIQIRKDGRIVSHPRISEDCSL